MGITVQPIINWRNEVHKTGLYSIHLRVTINRERKYYLIKTPQKLALTDWTGMPETWVKNTHPFAFEINNRINEKKGIVNEVIKRFYLQNKPINFYAIDRELNRKGDRTILNDYFRNYIDNPPATVNLDAATWEKYEACLTHLNAFQPKIPFGQIDGTLVARFRNYLANRKGRKGKMDPATLKSYFDKFKVVIAYAAKKDNLLDKNDLESYYEDVKIAVPRKKEGKHLEIEELQLLRKLAFDKNERSLERDRDLFLFQAYTGFYYNDLQILRKDQLFRDIEYGSYIIGERDKNGHPTIIPLFKFPYANEVIEKYRDNIPANDLLFRRDAFVEVQVYNRNLKILAKKAAIPRTLSNKTGRHTNAQMWIRFGAERPVLSKMMGHGKEQTTENYYRVNLKEVIEGTKAANFEKLAI